MKTKIAILIFMLCLNVSLIVGQGIVKRQIFPTNLETYLGTWEYTSGNEVFRVYLKIGTLDSKVSFGTCVIGDYFYSKNNVVLDSYTISNIPIIYKDFSGNEVIIFASNGKFESVNYANPNELNMFFYDKKRKKKVYRGMIQLISCTQIRWILRDDEGDYDGDNWVEPGFSVPTNVVMTKI